MNFDVSSNFLMLYDKNKTIFITCESYYGQVSKVFNNNLLEIKKLMINAQNLILWEHNY